MPGEQQTTLPPWRAELPSAEERARMEEWKAGFLARLDREPRDASKPEQWLKGWDDAD